MTLEYLKFTGCKGNLMWLDNLKSISCFLAKAQGHLSFDLLFYVCF